MMKWLKRLMLLVIFLLILGGTVGAVGWWMSRRPPEWYSRRQASPEQVQAAADRAQRQIQRTLSWAADQQAYADSSRQGAPTTHPDKSIEIALTEEELNGFFQAWDSHFHWTRQLHNSLADPQIVLRDGQIILAAMVKQMGTVVSIEFEPKLADGKLYMPVEQVLAGRLPVPQSFWEGYRTDLVDHIESHLPDWQAGARIRPNGTANPDAVAAGMGQLLANLLSNRPADPILFLPYDVGNSQRAMPVKIVALSISERTLHLTLQPLSPQERNSLITLIQGSALRTAAKNSDHSTVSE